MLMWHDKTAKTSFISRGILPKTSHFPRKQTVHRRTLEVERGSCSLDLGLSGLDRGAGWASRSTAGARRADIEPRSSAELRAVFPGGSRRFTSDEAKVK